MFVGHLAVSLTAKVVEPKAPLSALVAASFGLDLVWPFLVLAGLEAVSVAGQYSLHTAGVRIVPMEPQPAHGRSLGSHCRGPHIRYGASKNQRIALLVGTVLISHWILDFLTHRPDLPLWPGGPKFGLGLWNSIPATILVEGGLFLEAIGMYVRAFKPRDAVGRWALWALVVFTSVIWITQPWSPAAAQFERRSGRGFGDVDFPLVGGVDRPAPFDG